MNADAPNPLPSVGLINARIKWLEKHIAIERRQCARRVQARAMHPHTADEVINGLTGIHQTLVAARDVAQAQQGPAEAVEARPT